MLVTITHSPCIDDDVPFSYQENAFIEWVDTVFCEGYKRPESDTEGRPRSVWEAIDIVEAQGYSVITVVSF